MHHMEDSRSPQLTNAAIPGIHEPAGDGVPPKRPEADDSCRAVVLDRRVLLLSDSAVSIDGRMVRFCRGSHIPRRRTVTTIVGLAASYASKMLSIIYDRPSTEQQILQPGGPAK
jgi:hypothetical protein